MDGLPYEITSLLFNYPGISKLAIEVYNDALLKELAAYIPYQHRRKDLHTSPESPPHRFIGENGRLLQLIMASAFIQKSDAIGLLLDQEKIFDQIHPGYLTRVLCRFRAPSQLVHIIVRLFFSTKITQRGLSQDDPLSPLLFNIAFDPFLRLISTDLTFHRFSFSTISDGSSDVGSNGGGSSDDPFDNNAPPPPVKILAYTDDGLVLVNSPSDFTRLQWAVDIYTSTSNALLNYNKT
ncbi:hypothetical protein G6F43_009638 [Rhizopus delemar]|nr:hypothetical protein G6F43_009638 [Rhizopus delemar]